MGELLAEVTLTLDDIERIEQHVPDDHPLRAKAAAARTELEERLDGMVICPCGEVVDGTEATTVAHQTADGRTHLLDVCPECVTVSRCPYSRTGSHGMAVTPRRRRVGQQRLARPDAAT